jgi:hypothetical protein
VESLLQHSTAHAHVAAVEQHPIHLLSGLLVETTLALLLLHIHTQREEATRSLDLMHAKDRGKGRIGLTGLEAIERMTQQSRPRVLDHTSDRSSSGLQELEHVNQ